MDLAPHSRVWIFQASRFLEDKEVEWMRTGLKTFIRDWAAHGNDLYGDFEVAYNLFIIIAVDEKRAPASGCSIDKLNRKIQEIGKELNIDFFDRMQVAYEDPSSKIHLVTLKDFQKLMKKDQVTRQTIVYNNLIETLADLDENWRTTVEKSWHSNLLQII